MSAQCAYDVWSSAYRLWAKKLAPFLYVL